MKLYHDDITEFHNDKWNPYNYLQEKFLVWFNHKLFVNDFIKNMIARAG